MKAGRGRGVEQRTYQQQRLPVSPVFPLTAAGSPLSYLYTKVSSYEQHLVQTHTAAGTTTVHFGLQICVCPADSILLGVTAADRRVCISLGKAAKKRINMGTIHMYELTRSPGVGS